MPISHLGIAGSVNSLIRNIGMVVVISIATSTFAVMSHNAGYRVTGLITNRPDLFIDGMPVVFICSAFICFASALLTGRRLVKSRVFVTKRPPSMNDIGN
jgi:hypothetical protein